MFVTKPFVLPLLFHVGPLIAKNFCGSILADCFVLTPHNNQLRHCQRNTHSSRIPPSLHLWVWSYSTFSCPTLVMVANQRNHTRLLLGPRPSLGSSTREIEDTCSRTTGWWYKTYLAVEFKCKMKHLYVEGFTVFRNFELIIKDVLSSVYITASHWWVYAPLPKVTKTCSRTDSWSYSSLLSSITLSAHNLGKHKHPQPKNRLAMTHDFATKG